MYNPQLPGLQPTLLRTELFCAVSNYWWDVLVRPRGLPSPVSGSLQAHKEPLQNSSPSLVPWVQNSKIPQWKILYCKLLTALHKAAVYKELIFVQSLNSLEATWKIFKSWYCACSCFHLAVLESLCSWVKCSRGERSGRQGKKANALPVLLCKRMPSSRSKTEDKLFLPWQWCKECACYIHAWERLCWKGLKAMPSVKKSA